MVYFCLFVPFLDSYGPQCFDLTTLRRAFPRLAAGSTPLFRPSLGAPSLGAPFLESPLDAESARPPGVGAEVNAAHPLPSSA